MTTDCFISIDWGTTNFRISVIEIPSLKVLELIESAEGVKEIYSDVLINNPNFKFYLTKTGNVKPIKVKTETT